MDRDNCKQLPSLQNWMLKTAENNCWPVNNLLANFDSVLQINEKLENLNTA